MMAEHLTLVLLVTLFTFFTFLRLSDGQDSVTLSVGAPRIMVIPPLGELSFKVEDIPADASFLVLQVHAQRYDLALSMSSTFAQGQTVSGKSLGVLALLDTTPQFFLRSSVNASIRYLAAALSYTNSDPLPGGCNQVFVLENDPNVLLEESGDVTRVVFQWGDTNGGTGNCESSPSIAELTYDLYVAYAPSVNLEEEEFFNTVQTMLMPEDIMAKGNKVASFVDGQDKSTSLVSAVRGTGTVYAVVVKQKSGKLETYASYVPTTTYSCSFQSNDTSENSCDFLANNYDTFTFVVAIIFGLCGLVICLFGHYLFRFGIFVAGMWLACLAVGAGISHLTFDFPAYQVIVLPTGVVFGLLWVGLWQLLQRPLQAVLPALLLMGVLLASVLYYTPFGNVSYFKMTLLFSLTTVLVIVLVLAFGIIKTRATNIIALAFTGSFMVMLALDISVRGSFRYIFFNYFRRVAVPGFLGAVTVAPVQVKAIGLMGGWVVLFVLGLVLQFYMARKRPHFPQRRVGSYRLLGQSYGTADSRSGQRIAGQDGDFSERSPLLPDYGGNPQDQYGPSGRMPVQGHGGSEVNGVSGAARSAELESVASARNSRRK